MLGPLTQSTPSKQTFMYANEADLVNIALFGVTAKQWRDQNPEEAKRGNIRDSASVEQHTVLANLESLNSMFISQGVGKKDRFAKLHSEAQRQLSSLVASKLRIEPIEDSPQTTLSD